MRNSDKLSALGVKDDDLLMMMVSNASSGYNAGLNIFEYFFLQLKLFNVVTYPWFLFYMHVVIQWCGGE